MRVESYPTKPTKTVDKPFPKKMSPKISRLLFVSVCGFDDEAMTHRLAVDDCEIELVDGTRLNEMLKQQGLRRIPQH